MSFGNRSNVTCIPGHKANKHNITACCNKEAALFNGEAQNM
jgi:hypothetical protein